MSLFFFLAKWKYVDVQLLVYTLLDKNMNLGLAFLKPLQVELEAMCLAMYPMSLHTFVFTYGKV